MTKQYQASISLFAISLGLLPSVLAQAPSPSSTAPKAAQQVVRDLSVDEVLGWRRQYDDLLGSDVGVAKEKFGPPDSVEGGYLVYSPSVKTGNRSVRFLPLDGKIAIVYISLNVNEEDLDVMNILVQAPLFCFRTGTWRGTTNNFFEAQSHDGRSLLQFRILQQDLVLDRVIFLAPAIAKPCDPGHVAPTSE
jgi:hypothetical protein